MKIAARTALKSGSLHSCNVRGEGRARRGGGRTHGPGGRGVAIECFGSSSELHMIYEYSSLEQYRGSLNQPQPSHNALI